MGKFDDIMLEIARDAYPDKKAINKFGESIDGVQTTLTDIWDLADATPTQSIWLPPTQARTHAIYSGSAVDNSGSGGASQIKIYGLTSWDTAEITEVVNLNGTTPVNTQNEYVIIHRMIVTSSGSTYVNAGTISASAIGDGTITACILPGIGQTQMAIYGIPSIKSAYITGYYASTLRNTNVAYCDIELVTNVNPQEQLLSYVTKHSLGLVSAGTSHFDHKFQPYYKVAGPAIIKIQGKASVSDLSVAAGFDLILSNYV